MKPIYIPNTTVPFAARIDNMFSDDELYLIRGELRSFETKYKPPHETQSARGEGGKILKHNSALWMDEVFKDTSKSDILRINRKVVRLSAQLEAISPMFRAVKAGNINSTLISRYVDGDYYEPHFDRCAVTVLTYFLDKPELLEGGEVSFTDYDVTVPVEDNLCIVFPSMLNHMVSPVVSKGGTRYCMAQFITVTN